MDMEIKNLLGLREGGKRIYQIDSTFVSQEEFEFCTTMYQVLWGDLGLVQTLGPTWNMVMDPRFETIENLFITDRKAVFGGDARLGKQYIGGEGILSGNISDLSAYAEIIGEGRHFHSVVSEVGIDPKEFHLKPVDLLWKFVRQECPNYFDNVSGQPNKVAHRLIMLFQSDLLGLIDDYAEIALVQEWIRVETGEAADPKNLEGVDENPIVYAEIDLLERALTLRASLRVTAAKILDKTGVMSYLDKHYQLTDWETDQILKIVYTSPYDKLYEAPMKVMDYVKARTVIPYEKRLSKELSSLSTASRATVSMLKEGSLAPLTVSNQEEIHRDLTLEETQAIALREDPNMLELFTLFVEAEGNHDQFTMNLIQPYLDHPETKVSDEALNQVKQASLTHRTSSSVLATLNSLKA